MRAAISALLALPLVAIQLQAQPSVSSGDLERAGATITAEKLMTRIRALANDSMLGRGPGQRGDTLTTRYLEGEMSRIGLTPAGADGFRQPVSLHRAKAAAAFRITAGGREVGLRQDSEIFLNAETIGAARLDDAPLVLVGHGIDAPEFRWNDYKARSLAGKVALILDAEPEQLARRSFAPNSGATYHAMWFLRARYALARGASAVIMVRSGPDSVHAKRARRAQHDALISEHASTVPSGDFLIQISASAADRLARSIGDSLAGWRKVAADSSFNPVDIPIRISVEQRVTSTPFVSNNLVGIIRGSDPRLRDECVVYVAHWDGYGIGPAVAGDSIYNGALDNAGGVSSMLAIAEGIRRVPRAPARTIVFLATTAEESGTLGADAYVANPVCPMSSTQLAVGLDWTWTWGRTPLITSNGFGYSTVDSLAADVAQRVGKSFGPGWADYWMASDQSAFLTRGVPSWFGGLDGDVIGKPKGWAMQQLMTTATHIPGDEILSTWDMSGSAEETRFLMRLGVAAAEMQTHLRWTVDSEFARAAARRATR